MKFKCWILTAKFYSKVEDYLEQEARNYTNNPEMIPYCKIGLREGLYNYWRGKSKLSEEAFKTLKKRGLLTPKYYVRSFNKENFGREQARIKWKKKVTKISNIPSIYQYQKVYVA